MSCVIWDTEAVVIFLITDGYISEELLFIFFMKVNPQKNMNDLPHSSIPVIHHKPKEYPLYTNSYR